MPSLSLEKKSAGLGEAIWEVNEAFQAHLIRADETSATVPE